MCHFHTCIHISAHRKSKLLSKEAFRPADCEGLGVRTPRKHRTRLCPSNISSVYPKHTHKQTSRLSICGSRDSAYSPGHEIDRSGLHLPTVAAESPALAGKKHDIRALFFDVTDWSINHLVGQSVHRVRLRKTVASTLVVLQLSPRLSKLSPSPGVCRHSKPIDR